MNPNESVPTTWDDARDESFFRITQNLLDARFLAFATTQLSANDSEHIPA